MQPTYRKTRNGRYRPMFWHRREKYRESVGALTYETAAEAREVARRILLARTEPAARLAMLADSVAVWKSAGLHMYDELSALGDGPEVNALKHMIVNSICLEVFRDVK